MIIKKSPLEVELSVEYFNCEICEIAYYKTQAYNIKRFAAVINDCLSLCVTSNLRDYALAKGRLALAANISLVLK